MDDVVEFSSFYILPLFRCSLLVVRTSACVKMCVFMATTVNICQVIFLTVGLINFLNCAALNQNLNINGR